MPILTIPIYRQGRGTRSCGLWCLKMIYEYYGRVREIHEISAALQMMPTGVYAQELGYHLRLSSFGARLITRDTTRLPVQYAAMDPAAIRDDLTARLERVPPERQKERIYLRGLLRFLEVGGEIEVRVPTIDDLARNVAAGHPVVCSLDVKALYEHDGAHTEEDPADWLRLGPGAHYVVVSGVEGDRVWVNDPSSRRHGGIRAYPRERFLYAWYSFQGYALLVGGPASAPSDDVSS
ncbi:MAG: hypothetical protein HY691_12975 [Chloroflexi bacterium]|nr:hypothetical protein [Chloroflexota bacterium]